MTLRFTLAQRLGLRIRAVPELLGCRDNATPCFLGDSMLPIERKAQISGSWTLIVVKSGLARRAGR